MSAPRRSAIELLGAVREALAAVALPLPLDDAVEQRDAAAAAVRQIDDYIRPASPTWMRRCSRRAVC